MVRCKTLAAANETHCAAGDLPERSSKKAGNGEEEDFVPFSVQGFLAHQGRKEEGALLPVETPRACFARILLDSAVVLHPRDRRVCSIFAVVFLVSVS